MKLKKLLLLPMLFTLTSCDFSFNFITNLFEGEKSQNSIEFTDEKVGKATAIPKRVKEALQKEVKNVFSRDWLKNFGETKPSVNQVYEFKNKNLLEGECLASFENTSIENRLMKQINDTYYSLPIKISKEGDEYKFGGAGGVWLEWEAETNPNINLDKEKYCESALECWKQQMFFSDSIVEYLDNSFSTFNDALDSMSGEGVIDDLNQMLKQLGENLKNGLKENMICVENSSKGNCVLDIKAPFNLFSSTSSSSQAGFEYQMTFGETIETCRLTFDNYMLTSSTFIYDTFSSFTMMGETTTQKSYLGGYAEYKYNVDPSTCFTNSVEVLTEEQARTLLYSIERN